MYMVLIKLIIYTRTEKLKMYIIKLIIKDVYDIN